MCLLPWIEIVTDKANVSVVVHTLRACFWRVSWWWLCVTLNLTPGTRDSQSARVLGRLASRISYLVRDPVSSRKDEGYRKDTVTSAPASACAFVRAQACAAMCSITHLPHAEIKPLVIPQ